MRIVFVHNNFGIFMNKKSGKTTIYDVAKAAGVSTSTVSKVFNYPESAGITVATRDRILAVARELDYPKLNRTSNPERDLKRVAVIVPSLMNPYYASMISGIEQALRETDMLMTLYCSHNNPKLEIQSANQIKNTRAAGVIISSICQKTSHIRQLMESGISVVASEQQVDLPCSKVYFNYEKGGYMAAEHLIKSGRSRIAFVSSPLTRPSRRQVLDGYKKALADNGLYAWPELLRVARDEVAGPNELYEFQNGILQMNQLLRDKVPVDAVFCINDITAIGVIHAIEKQGLSIPEQIAVVGFDNIIYSEMLNPTLTTIEQSAHELGSLAADLLIRNIKDSSRESVSLTLEPKLIIRSSG